MHLMAIGLPVRSWATAIAITETIDQKEKSMDEGIGNGKLENSRDEDFIYLVKTLVNARSVRF